jgi:hypothetical protein
MWFVRGLQQGLDRKQLEQKTPTDEEMRTYALGADVMSQNYQEATYQ